MSKLELLSSFCITFNGVRLLGHRLLFVPRGFLSFGERMLLFLSFLSFSGLRKRSSGFAFYAI